MVVNNISYNQSKYLHTSNTRMPTFLLYKIKSWLLFKSFSEQYHVIPVRYFQIFYLQIYSLRQGLFVNLIPFFHYLYSGMYHIRMLSFHMVQKFWGISDEIWHQIFFEWKTFPCLSCKTISYKTMNIMIFFFRKFMEKVLRNTYASLIKS